jgi:hypothetical protein
VAGRKRVPSPATGKTALNILVLIRFSFLTIAVVQTERAVFLKEH